MSVLVGYWGHSGSIFMMILFPMPSPIPPSVCIQSPYYWAWNGAVHHSFPLMPFVRLFDGNCMLRSRMSDYLLMPHTFPLPFRRQISIQLLDIRLDRKLWFSPFQQYHLRADWVLIACSGAPTVSVSFPWNLTLLYEMLPKVTAHLWVDSDLSTLNPDQ